VSQRQRFLVTFLAAGLFGLGLAAPAGAYGQLAFELRPGVAVGAYEPTQAGLEFVPRLSLHLQAGYPVRPAVEAFVAGGFSSFGCTGGFCTGTEPTFTRAGMDLGARLAMGTLPMAPWGTLGLSVQSLHATDGGEWSSPAPGLTMGGGLSFPLSGRLTLTPGLHYSIFRVGASEVDQGGIADVFALQVGVRFR
jgi:hypothetical protein